MEDTGGPNVVTVRLNTMGGKRTFTLQRARFGPLPMV